MSYDAFAGTVGGKKALFVLPTIPDGAPPAVREGLARRRVAILTGRCPCGGRSGLNRAARRARRGKVVNAEFVHEGGCPATDEELRKFGWVPMFGGGRRG